MNIKTEKKEKGMDILLKISLVLLGIFATSIVFKIATNLFGVPGIYIAGGISLAIVFIGFYYGEKGSKIRLITWGITGSLILGIIAFLFLMYALSDVMEGFNT